MLLLLREVIMLFQFTRQSRIQGKREAEEISDKFPKVQRRVGGYNLDALVPRNAPNNMAHLLVGSEGTLAFTTQVELKLWPVIRNKVLGVCHFGSFYEGPESPCCTNCESQAGRAAQRQEVPPGTPGVGSVHSIQRQGASPEAGEGADRSTQPAQ